MFVNYYEILEISRESNLEQIKKAFRKQAIKFHPDKHRGNNDFASKFMLIKEAYDILSDDTKKTDYDLQWDVLKTKSQTEQKEKPSTEETINNEKYSYDPYKPFYSFTDRDLHDTPQFNPTKNPWGGEIIDEIFFILPKRIGKLIGGYSTLRKGDKQHSVFKYIIVTLKESLLIAVIAALIMGFLFYKWTENNVPNPDQKAIIGFAIIYLFFLIILLGRNSNIYQFINLNYFIGINGFAYFTSKGKNFQIIDNKEFNFNEITHLFTIEIQKVKNFHYEGTDYSFAWTNKKTNKTVYENVGRHNSKDENPSFESYPYYGMNKIAEKYWTIYLLDNMEKELSEKGYIQFDVFHEEFTNLIPYLRLEVGKITFINGKKNITYNISDIKRVYIKNQCLYLEHNNYSKKFIFFESGDKEFIPINLMGNKLYFLKALELLMGYKL